MSNNQKEGSSFIGKAVATIIITAIIVLIGNTCSGSSSKDSEYDYGDFGTMRGRD